MTFVLPPAFGTYLLASRSVTLPAPWPATEPPAALFDGDAQTEQEATLTGVPPDVPAGPFIALFRQRFPGVLRMSVIRLAACGDMATDTYQLVLRRSASIPHVIPLQIGGQTFMARLWRKPLVPPPTPATPAPPAPPAPPAGPAPGPEGGAPAPAAPDHAEPTPTGSAPAAPDSSGSSAGSGGSCSSGDSSGSPPCCDAAGTAPSHSAPPQVTAATGAPPRALGRSRSALQLRSHSSSPPPARTRSLSPAGRARLAGRSEAAAREDEAAYGWQRELWQEHQRRHGLAQEPAQTPPAPSISSAAGSPAGQHHAPSSPSSGWVSCGDTGGSTLAAGSCSQPSSASPPSQPPGSAADGADTADSSAHSIPPPADAPAQRSKGKRHASDQPECPSARMQRIQADAPDGVMQDAQ